MTPYDITLNNVRIARTTLECRYATAHVPKYVGDFANQYINKVAFAKGYENGKEIFIICVSTLATNSLLLT